MSSNKMISVIVPAYNAEKYLPNCIDSILGQTYKDIELILVDDGSTDGTNSVCCEYAKRDNRIIIITQENGGSVCARKNGVEHAKGAYCCFCDSDDTMPLNALEKLYNALVDNDCDLSFGTIRRASKVKLLSFYFNRQVDSSNQTIRVYSKDEIMNNLYHGYFGGSGMSVNLYAKLYKTDMFLKSISSIGKAPRLFFGDDLFMNIRVIPNLNRVVSIPDVIYDYNYGGGTQKFMPRFLDENIIIYNLKTEFANKYNLPEYNKQLVKIELKNVSEAYLMMCRQKKIYPHGSLQKEAEYLNSIPEVNDAIVSFDKSLLPRDGAEFPGYTQSMIDKDYAKTEEVILNQIKKTRFKNGIKKIVNSMYKNS